ncbi:hypothetical protein IMZ11_02035 [Microtetraspora sp. AC03309]|uniref:hypothetical protein n=1 Tax=Microtetraspora sp. AC03309 TaxID=2779376 RepID=UPI001E3DC4EA|nr:hypothetical protein [Microtetraspora sp. AC03309]MCC5574419.1 hypothetical protein [Microtetraspora sp. AC03309]
MDDDAASPIHGSSPDPEHDLSRLESDHYLEVLAGLPGFRVRDTLATERVDEPVGAADDKQPTKAIDRYGRVDGRAAHRCGICGANYPLHHV